MSNNKKDTLSIKEQLFDEASSYLLESYKNYRAPNGMKAKSLYRQTIPHIALKALFNSYIYLQASEAVINEKGWENSDDVKRNCKMLGDFYAEIFLEDLARGRSHVV